MRFFMKNMMIILIFLITMSGCAISSQVNELEASWRFTGDGNYGEIIEFKKDGSFSWNQYDGTRMIHNTSGTYKVEINFESVRKGEKGKLENQMVPIIKLNYKVGKIEKLSVVRYTIVGSSLYIIENETTQYQKVSVDVAKTKEEAKK